MATTVQGKTGIPATSLYLGAAAADPTAQTDGSALVAGNYYFKTADALTYTYNGATWAASDINTANLAASGGSALIGHIDAGTGAVATTLQTEARRIVFPERYGCTGDGTTDDVVNFRKAITAAGVGGFIKLTPGKTYLFGGGVTLLQGQTVWGYGAAVKRCAEKSSATSTNIGTGSSPTAITVADGTQFAAGMDVTVYSGATYDPASHRVNSVVGNVVTVATNFSVAFPTGGTLITCGQLIYTAAQNVSVVGLEINGNRANNTSLAKWQTHCGAYLLGNYNSARNCYIHDEVSEGMELGGNGSVADSNFIVNCGGNGIHFSGSAGGKAVNNYVYNVTILGTATGHADGGIIFSNTTGDSIIANNYIDTAISGVASVDTDDNSSVVISGNVIKNMTTTAIEGSFPAATTGGKVSIIGNMIYSSQTVLINSTTGSYTAGAGPYDWIVSGNYLENTTLTVNYATGVTVTNNRIRAVADTTSTLLSVTGTRDILITGNTFVGGLYGVASAANYEKVHGNTFKNQYGRAVNVSSAGTAISVEDNTVVVESTYTTNGTYIGVAAQNNTYVRGNTMDIQTAAGSYGIYCPSGGAGVNGAFVTTNLIKSTGLTASIRTDGGSQNNVIVANFVQQAISNAGGASNTVSGNFTIN